MHTLHHDVLIIGGGGAGLRAALAVAEVAPGLRVGLASKVYPMRSHTGAAEGGAAAVIRDDDSLDEHAYDTISGGDWLCDQDAVEDFVKEAPAELLLLERWGCPWSRRPDGRTAVRSFGGMKNERTWFAADKTGFHLLHTLYQRCLSLEHLAFHDEWLVTRLLVEDGVCRGAVALELTTGRVVALLAFAVILCTGGAGKIYPFTTNANIKTGDGMALAYRVGVPLKDMEFVQYHPTGLPFTGILITEAARSEGAWLVNNEGYRYLQDYDLGSPSSAPVKRAMELGPRDRLSQAFVHEQERGRCLQTPYGDVVHLDLRHLGERLIHEKLPFVRELCRTYEKIDPVHELIPVRPVVHYMMGGVHTDTDAKTSVHGLFAAGEVACVSINGANRLGSNSLTELLVFGARAGKGAAACAIEQSAAVPAGIMTLAHEEERRLHARLHRRARSGERLADFRDALHAVMEEEVGIFRERRGLERAASSIAELQEHVSRASLDDASLTFNTALTGVLELENLLDVAEAVVHSALRREESRGAHQRRDFPARDNERFLQHSLAYASAKGPPRIEPLPVTITRWPPGERVYGKA
jgi:fumarate reductase flavoprotein subunit